MIMKRIILFFICLFAVSGLALNAQVPLYLDNNYYSKHMVKVFKALNDHKLEKAEKYWDEIMQKAANDKDLSHSRPISTQLYPVWNLSQALLMNTRAGRSKAVLRFPFDPWRAYQILGDVCRNGSDVLNANQFLSHKDIGLSVQSIKSAIEVNLIDTTRQINTEAAYDKLLEVLFDCDDIPVLEKEREQLAYNAVKAAPLAECQRFLDKYKNLNEAHFLTIEWRRDSLAFVALDKTAAACQRYIHDYPNSRFKFETEQLLHKYAFQELDKTVNACKEYLSLYPSSEYYNQVKALQEEYAYRDAKEANTIGAYYDFIKEYPRSESIDEATISLQQALMERYWRSNVNFNDLCRFAKSTDDIKKVLNATPIDVLFENLIFMPTSAMMMDCDGLTGSVKILTRTEYTDDSEELLDFNSQALMTSRYNSKTGIQESYSYTFDQDHGFILDSKTDANGKTVTYTTSWGFMGALAEIKGSDGSRINYGYSDDFYKKITYYNGNTLVKTDYYDSNYRLIKSVRPGNVTIEYERNNMGDVVSMTKKRGSTTLEETTYQYEYGTKGDAKNLPIRISQYNNGNYVLAKDRTFYQITDRVLLSGDNGKTIDWHSKGL